MHQKQLDLDEALPKEFTRRLARCGECGARDADWKAAFASRGAADFARRRSHVERPSADCFGTSNLVFRFEAPLGRVALFWVEPWASPCVRRASLTIAGAPCALRPREPPARTRRAGRQRAAAGEACSGYAV